MDLVHHCESSVRKFGGELDDYTEIHAFFDQSKLFEPRWKHRALLHHTLGVDLCETKFGHIVTRASDSKPIAVRPIAEQHVLEDLGALPTPYWYWRELDRNYQERLVGVGFKCPYLPFNFQMCRSILIDKFGGQKNDYDFLIRLLQKSELYLPDSRLYVLLHTTFGVAIARSLYGETVLRNSDSVQLSVAELTKELIVSEVGVLLTPEHFFEMLPIRPWMNGMRPITRRRLSNLVNQELENLEQSNV